MNQTTAVRSLFRNMQGNQDSVIREIFAFGIGNTGHFCLWDPEYGKFFLWDPEYKKLLFMGSGIREIFVCGITGSPSALCVGSGFRGHLVGIY